jgi:hypothetical protein
MEWQIGLSVGLLVYVAFVFDVLGFLARDELKLRILLLASGLFLTSYYFFVSDQPLWDAIVTNGMIDLVNFTMICVVIHERSTLAMPATTVAIYDRFSMMTPGQFRKVFRAGRLRTAARDETLAVEGAPLPRLFYVLDGEVEVEKHGTRTPIGRNVFIGEIAFLHDVPATATVRIREGSHYLEWTHEDLKALTARHPAIRTALLAHLNLDLSRKVAASSPGAMATVAIEA